MNRWFPIHQNRSRTIRLIQEMNYVIYITCRNYLNALIFISPLIALIHVQEKTYKFHLTVKIDLDDVVDLVDWKQVFHLLHDLSVTPLKAILFFHLIS